MSPPRSDPASRGQHRTINDQEATLRQPDAYRPCEDAAVPAPMPVVSDSVITLRRWAGSDARFLLDASGDPVIQRYSLSRSRPLTAAEAQEEVRDYEAKWLSAHAL